MRGCFHDLYRAFSDTKRVRWPRSSVPIRRSCTHIQASDAPKDLCRKHVTAQSISYRSTWTLWGELLASDCEDRGRTDAWQYDAPSGSFELQIPPDTALLVHVPTLQNSNMNCRVSYEKLGLGHTWLSPLSETCIHGVQNPRALLEQATDRWRRQPEVPWGPSGRSTWPIRGRPFQSSWEPWPKLMIRNTEGICRILKKGLLDRL